jgi:hypothetical protein
MCLKDESASVVIDARPGAVISVFAGVHPVLDATDDVSSDEAGLHERSDLVRRLIEIESRANLIVTGASFQSKLQLAGRYGQPVETSSVLSCAISPSVRGASWNFAKQKRLRRRTRKRWKL